MSTEQQITSTANPRIKAVVRLRDRRERDATGLTLVDGAREIRRAVESGVDIDDLYLCGRQATSADALAAIRATMALGIEPIVVTEHVMERLAFGERSEGLLAVVRPPRLSLDDLALPATPLVAVIEGVEKPGNLGAILRSADGAGVDAVIAADPRTDLFNPNAIRASLGTIFARPVVAASSVAVREWTIRHALKVVAARVDGGMVYTSANLTGSLAIVLGSEAAGLSDAWTGHGITAVRLPMRGTADSLNVASAAAVLFYEALRQRGATAS